MAQDPQQAASLALAIARDMLQNLRLKHSLRTTLYGTISVVECFDEQKEFVLGLPTPYWPQKGSRQVAKIRTSLKHLRRNLTDHNEHRWRAATWHISAAVSQWPEDIHGAASEVWQAIESFAGSRQAATTEMIGEYLQRLPEVILTDMSRRIASYAWNLSQLQGSCDWSYWNSKSRTLSSWLGAIFRQNSRQSIDKWRRPSAPAILYDRNAGLLNVWRAPLIGAQAPFWAKERLLQDFAFLYGLRNSAVHTGTRIGKERLGGYLGRVGLEVLRESMNERAGKQANEVK
jgi:hypothetical protein